MLRCLKQAVINSLFTALTSTREAEIVLRGEENGRQVFRDSHKSTLSLLLSVFSKNFLGKRYSRSS